MVNTSLKPLTNHLKSTLNNKEDGRNSSILFFYWFKLAAVFNSPHTKNFKHYDYGESCGFYNNSNVFRKKDELKGVRNSFRTAFLSFLGARPRLGRCNVTVIINKSARIRSNHDRSVEALYCLIFFWLCSGFAKIIRPAAVWRALVTTTSISWFI